jgi:EAL domain-containing protein (putative c-di-GMP-specific phosphodiesterase class I)
LLAPADFLSIAEDAGLMSQICAWVLDEALAQGAQWENLPTHPQVFLNLAADQLSQPEFVDHLTERTTAHGVDPARVRLEVSERMLTSDIDAMSKLMTSIRDRGFGVAVDDFGAGNTSLAWLRQLPLDVLKLDRQFTIALAEPATRAIVSALTQLAPALGITSLADGVETADQLKTLADLGCDYAQGYHLSRPFPPTRPPNCSPAADPAASVPARTESHRPVPNSGGVGLRSTHSALRVCSGARPPPRVALQHGWGPARRILEGVENSPQCHGRTGRWVVASGGGGWFSVVARAELLLEWLAMCRRVARSG